MAGPDSQKIWLHHAGGTDKLSWKSANNKLDFHAVLKRVKPLMNMSRRQAIRTFAAAAAAGATWFDAFKASVKAATHLDFAGLPMGIQSYSLRGFDADKAMDIIQKDLELHFVEMFRAHYPVTTDEAAIATMTQKLKAHELKLTAHGVQAFTADHAKNEEFFKFAKAAGFKNLAADPTPDSFDSLEKLVKQYDLRIAIHNHGPGHRYDKVADCLKAVDGRDKRIGFCADLGHFIRSGEDCVKLLHEMKGRVWGVHLKDFDAPKKDAHGVVLGKGLLDVAGVFKALKAIEFPADGALSLEYEENPKNPIGEIQECVAVAAKAAKTLA